jgi:pseudaminic acid cytidylyltransferase
MGSVAIITARGGSKRIPRKNIKLFLDKPIISYSIQSALNSGIFEEVMVSTDDEEIAAIAKDHGASLPFMRSTENSNDYAGTAEVLIEVISQYRKIKRNFDTACCIYPTAPFVTAEKLKKAFDLLREKNADSVLPVTEFSYPILRSLKVNEQGQIEMNWPQYYSSRSQDLPKSYHDSGQFYFLNVESLLHHKKLFMPNSFPLIVPETEVQDIDNETDWKLAEMKYLFLYDQ